MLTYIPVSFLFSFKKGFGLGLKIGLGFGFEFGIGNLIGGAAGTVDPCGRKIPVHGRHIRVDMIETYKILTRKYDVAAVPALVQACTYVTRGVCNISIVYIFCNKRLLRLQKTRFKYDVRKYCFTNRVVNNMEQFTKLGYLS